MIVDSIKEKEEIFKRGDELEEVKSVDQKNQEEFRKEETKKTLEEEVNIALDNQFLAKEIVSSRQSIKNLEEKIDFLTKELTKSKEAWDNISYSKAMNSSNRSEDAKDIDPIAEWDRVMELNKKIKSY